MVRSRIFPFVALALNFALLVNGCLSQARLPNEFEDKLIQKQSGVIVLLRLRTVVDGKPSKNIRLWNRDEQAGFGFAVDIGRLNPGQSPDLALAQKSPVPLISPSSEARHEGWIYYVLPPDSYYLTVFDMDKKGWLAPGFKLTVSGEKKLVYAGTLDIACKPGFWGSPPRECRGVSLTDEGGAAQALAQEHFAKYGPISSSLMSKYDEADAASQRAPIFPMGYVTAGTKDLMSPDWFKRGITRTTHLMSDETMKGLAETHVGVGILTAYVAYLPLGLAAGAITGRSAEKKWQPCIQELAQEIKEIDPEAALQKELDEELKKFHASKTISLSLDGDPFQAAARRGLKSLLQTEVIRIQIRECQERGSFCIEVTVRARLWKIPEQSLYLDKFLVYSSASPSSCRKMEAYCGTEGKKIFQEEITGSIANLVKRLLIEVGL